MTGRPLLTLSWGQARPGSLRFAVRLDCYLETWLDVDLNGSPEEWLLRDAP